MPSATSNSSFRVPHDLLCPTASNAELEFVLSANDLHRNDPTAQKLAESVLAKVMGKLN